MNGESEGEWPPIVSERIFNAVQRVKVETLADCSDLELRPVLASLVRMSLIASLDKSKNCTKIRTAVLEVLSRIELVNSLVALLSIDFHSLETDVRKEQMLRSKVGSSLSESVLISNLELGPALEFERSDATRRLRLVLSELLAIIGQIQMQNSRVDETQQGSTTAITMRSSELFDHLVYFSEVCDVLCIAMAELPMLLFPPEVSEALLRLKYGPWLICHIVANQPDYFNEVVFYLLKNGDKQDEESSNSIRQQAIFLLCQMNPSEMVNVRTKCIDWCRMPSLALQLTIEIFKRRKDPDDLVSFMSGLLLGSDPQIRSWISFFVRSGQTKYNENLVKYRKCLAERLTELVESVNKSDRYLQDDLVVKASALLRLYTALRGIAGMKFSEEEIQLLFELITCQPPPSPAGVKFVSLGLSMLIACNSLISTPTLEKRTVAWIHWLVQKEDYFEEKSGVSASFGEMLLLMAIHFHSQELKAVCDLVCQTLGMKIVIRMNSMNKMKNIFIQEIFTEQVVASHAVKVPVTKNLSSKVTGFLPIHCIHQLLKSRVFSKNKVSIKDWIFRQICASSTPLHPIIPSLIEGYVNSILIPASVRGVHDQTNEPITEEEIKKVFKVPAFVKLSPKSNRRGSLTMSRESTPSRSKVSSRISSPISGMKQSEEDSIQYSLASQILMLYYVLLYENVRLSHMKSIVVSQRKILIYSHALLASLPIKYLIQSAEKEQDKFGGIFPQLLRLCSTQYPHLCLVQDWLDDGTLAHNDSTSVVKKSSKSVNIAELKEAFAIFNTCPSKITVVLQNLLTQPISDIWQFTEIFVSHIKCVLESQTSRLIRELYKKFWFRLNKVFPRQLWALTVNALEGKSLAVGRKSRTQDDLIFDPLEVLRCDKAVFSCGPILEIVLYILKACLAASRTHLSYHILENPIIDRCGMNSQVTNDNEREDLKNALIVTQESAAIQILLEAARLSDKKEESKLTDNREIQSLICSYLHDTFIAEPSLVKLVHFQGYPLDLLPITVSGVPSMHICLDFIPELLSQPDLEKQIFAIDLISHLSLQYSLPKSYSIGRLAINSLSTLLSVLSIDERNVLFPPILPALVRLCRAFPPLVEDVVTLLTQYGKIIISESCTQGYSSPRNIHVKEIDSEDIQSTIELSEDLKCSLSDQVLITFKEIVKFSLLEKNSF